MAQAHFGFSELSLLCRSLWDFVKCMLLLRCNGPCVTIFGSARLGEEDPVYDIARQLGRSLSRAGFTVMTGGGPGLMEAANRGARESGGRSLGCRMQFSFEEKQNTYLDKSSTARYLFVRKVMLCRFSSGFVALPGGYGTLDELFEMLTLIKTKKMPRKPVILLGEAFWRPLLSLLDEMMAAGTISLADRMLIIATDDISRVLAELAQQGKSQEMLPERIFTSAND
jgi:uncharacterized protein (TIGR00730 family)